MKKLVAFTLVLLLILSVCACNNQVSDNNDGQSQNNETTQPTDTQPQTDNQPPQEFVFAKPETNLSFGLPKTSMMLIFQNIRKNTVFLAAMSITARATFPRLTKTSSRLIRNIALFIP